MNAANAWAVVCYYELCAYGSVHETDNHGGNGYVFEYENSMTNKQALSCQCLCGQTQVAVAKPPMLRFHCHCTICQDLYKQPFSDVTVMWAKDATLTQGEQVAYKRPGLLLKRGVCIQCEQPIFATMTLFPGVKLAFVPANRYDDQVRLPQVTAHIFYHRRQSDSDDGLLKVKGFMKSELAISWLIVKSAFTQLFMR